MLSTQNGGAAPGLRFNLSHARGMVACAIAANVPVGIDVERVDHRIDYWPIASRYFSDDEIAQLNRCATLDRPARFVEIWTLKEAYFKATGQGLSESIRDCGFDVESDRVRVLPAQNAGMEAWQFAVFSVEPDARIAVAVHCPVVPAWTLTRVEP